MPQPPRTKQEKVADLQPWGDNPRTITPQRLEDLKASLVADAGMLQVRPVVARPDGTVIMGNQRLLAARELGWEKIPCVRVDVDDDTAKVWALRDNAGYGEWDEAGVQQLLAELNAADIDLQLTGFSEGELASLLEDDTAGPGAGGDTDPLDLPSTPKTKLGDVYVLGPHRLVCGDATDQHWLDLVMAGDRADLVVTDPPYGVAYVGGDTMRTPEARKAAGGKTVANDELTVDALRHLLERAFAGAIANTREGASWFVFAPPGPLFAVFGDQLQQLGVWRQTLVWVKDRFVPGRSDYHNRFEPILFGWTPGAGHHRPDDRTLDTVWEFPRPTRSEQHPTMKPVGLVEQAIANHTDAGGLVLDPFAGSGTTLIAAANLGRVARCVEIEPAYCDVIVDRWERHTGEKATKL